MKLPSKKPTAVVGLDIEAGSVAATEILVNGDSRLGRTGIAPLSPGVSRDGEIVDPEALAAALGELFDQHDLPRGVRVGVANQRTVVRTLRMPALEDRDELETAIRFQAQTHIPMPLEQAVLDWQVVTQGVGEGGNQMDVVLVAARRDMVDSLLGAMRAAGLKPLGIDVSAFAMIRALAASEGPTLEMASASYEERVLSGGEGAPTQDLTPARLYCNLGDVTNLAVARGGSCLFTRVSSFGMEGIAQRLAERREMPLDQARQWINYVGLEQPVEGLEGDPELVAASREALGEGASKLADELRLSIEFYGTQEGAVNIEGIVAGGPGTAIAGLVGHLQGQLGYAFEVGRPAALSHLTDAEAARLTTSYGLALES